MPNSLLISHRFLWFLRLHGYLLNDMNEKRHKGSERSRRITYANTISNPTESKAFHAVDLDSVASS
jgi:hypothetical protein